MKKYQLARLCISLISDIPGVLLKILIILPGNAATELNSSCAKGCRSSELKKRIRELENNEFFQML